MGRHTVSAVKRNRLKEAAETAQKTTPMNTDGQQQPHGRRSLPVQPKTSSSRHILQLLSGLMIVTAILLGFHMGWIYVGNGMDQIHTQQVLSKNEGFKEVKDSTANGGQRIAQAQEGDPPIETAPKHGAVLGWMHIPRFGDNWKRAIQQGTDLTVLDNYGLGHYENTVMPGGKGNSAYAGHRTPGDLGPADRLETGDAIVIQTADYWYVYEMQSSWQTTPENVNVLSDQGDARIITLTTCKNSLNLQDSLSARFIVRGRFKYWAKTADGIPQELVLDKSNVVKQAHATVSETVQKVSKHMPVNRFFAVASGMIWLLFFSVCWLVWRKDRKPLPSSWSLFTWLWRIQTGPIPLKAISWLMMWMTIMFAQWAWLSPWLATIFPMFSGNGALTSLPPEDGRFPISQ